MKKVIMYESSVGYKSKADTERLLNEQARQKLRTVAEIIIGKLGLGIQDRWFIVDILQNNLQVINEAYQLEREKIEHKESQDCNCVDCDEV